MLSLLGTHLILHISRIRVNVATLPENVGLHMTVTFGVSLYWVCVLGIMEFSSILKVLKSYVILFFK